MSQFHFRPDDYLDLMHAEVPAFDELQDRVAAATQGPDVKRILELGTGTGETARRVLHFHPQARLTGIDVSEDMLARARQTLPPDRVDELLVGGIQDPLPDGPFELVVSALTIHHLDGPAKADLFQRLARLISSGGRFVMGDVVVPDDPTDIVTPITPGYDLPSSTEDLLNWLRGAGFVPRLTWQAKDLVVVTSELRGAGRRR
ncbi:MAG: class I SAM-dependent methyltransferase [Actinomycetota bacterium]|nr:class I SAM-dependent methyltransferase [Actinomycetota bacterium]